MKAILRLTALLLPGIFWAAGAYAATPPTPQFDVLGFIQEATLDATVAICTQGNNLVTGRATIRTAQRQHDDMRRSIHHYDRRNGKC